ncbi:MAG: cell envelope biogenesis protein OmpA, partial [Bacteroidetes bacterium]
LEEHDVPADRFEMVGLGPTRPVASNATAAGRRQNRRVRIAVQPAGPDTQPRAVH